MSDILDLETRKKIYILIEQNPGVHVNTIANHIEMKSQLIDYHLQYLEHHDLISIDKVKGFKRCYIKGKVGIKEKKLLSLLRQETPLRIVIFILKNPYCRHRDMLNGLNLSTQKLSYHLKKLVIDNIVQLSSSQGLSGYIVSDEKEIIDFLIKYQPTRLLTKVKDLWYDFHPG